MINSSSTESLLERMALNDVKAFEEVYNRYSSKMLLYALNILKKKEICEDLIQNIFIDFWSKRKQQQITNLEGYLFRAVKFQIFNHFRNQKFPDQDLTQLNIIDLSINASKKMEYDELEQAIHASVVKLPRRCKLIFELSRYQHKSNKEISSELGISMQAVKNQISKALIFIRQNLQKEELILFFVLFIEFQFQIPSL